MEISQEANSWLQFISCRLTFSATSILDKSVQVQRLFETVALKQMAVLETSSEGGRQTEENRDEPDLLVSCISLSRKGCAINDFLVDVLVLQQSMKTEIKFTAVL